MNIGTKIKVLRKERDITQEELADRLGVTFQAVSKWERGDSYPDITMIPAIAGFFNVTADELLGCTEAEKEKEIGEIIRRFQEYDNHEEGKKMEELAEESLKKYPGDYRIMSWFVYAWQVRKPERAIEVGEFLLDHCAEEGVRSFTRGSLVYAYKRSGNLKKAIELAESLPCYYDTRTDVMRGLLTGDELVVHIQHQCLDLAYEFWIGIRKICEQYAPADRIELYKKSNAVYDAFYENDLMPISLMRKMKNFQGMAEVALTEGDKDAGLIYMEQAVTMAEKHDALPTVVEVNSLLFNKHPYDRKYEHKENLKLKEELLYDFEHEDEFYAGLRNAAKYTELIKRLKAD
ncbi:MAG: helix-turn-helix domain-containing protein [Lachnospiraceae bacterium]|nr:helix-turn-helix domain-containing protein [Lachnospiraceae bacterium]